MPLYDDTLWTAGGGCYALSSAWLSRDGMARYTQRLCPYCLFLGRQDPMRSADGHSRKFGLFDRHKVQTNKKKGLSRDCDALLSHSEKLSVSIYIHQHTCMMMIGMMMISTFLWMIRAITLPHTPRTLPPPHGEQFPGGAGLNNTIKTKQCRLLVGYHHAPFFRAVAS